MEWVEMDCGLDVIVSRTGHARRAGGCCWSLKESIVRQPFGRVLTGVHTIGISRLAGAILRLERLRQDVNEKSRREHNR